jgi:membrane protease YdiL (CAAX protease family)
MLEPNGGHPQPVASPVHTVILLAIIFSVSWAGAMRAPGLRTHGVHHMTISYLGTMGMEFLITAFVVVGVRRRGGSLRNLVGGRWDRASDFFRDVLIAFCFWIVSLLCLAFVRIVMHAKAGIDAIRFLAPQSRAEAVLWIFVALTAGFCEEIIFRGYLQRQFIALSGQPILGILLSAVAFGGSHAYQGAKQTVILGVYGAMFGVLAYWRHSLRPGMMAHAGQDALVGLVIRLLPK